MRRFVLLIALLLVAAGCGGSQSARMPVVVDTDLSSDDVVALLYLLESPKVEVRAVAVSGTGLVECPAGARNALQLVALVGRSDVPVGCGRDTPLAGLRSLPDEWRSAADAMFGLTLPPTSARPSGDAVGILRRTAPGATVIELAPMTNLAAALRAQPDLARRVRRIVAMYGAVHVPGNAPDDPAFEVNQWLDPLATRIVERSGAPLTVVPLDATNDVPVTTWFAQALKRYHYATPAATAVWDILQSTGMANGSSYFWDPLAAAVAVDPTLVRLVGNKALSADRPRFEHELLGTLLGGEPFTIPPDRPDATLVFDGSACTYSGRRELTAGPFVLDIVNRSAKPLGWATGRLDGTHTLADLRRFAASLKGAPEAPKWFTADAGQTVPPNTHTSWPISAQLGATGSTIFLCLTEAPTRVWFAAQIPVFGQG
jgi:pyrimidine-specific ribonucleoside hydrolase